MYFWILFISLRIYYLLSIINCVSVFIFCLEILFHLLFLAMIGCILYGGVCFSTREMLNQHLNKKAEAVVAIKAKEQGHLGQIILTSSPNTGSSSSSPCPRTTSSFPQGIFCGFLAGLLGQSASYPFDIVRRRMQTYSPAQLGHSKFKIPKKYIFRIEKHIFFFAISNINFCDYKNPFLQKKNFKTMKKYNYALFSTFQVIV